MNIAVDNWILLSYFELTTENIKIICSCQFLLIPYAEGTFLWLFPEIIPKTDSAAFSFNDLIIDIFSIIIFRQSFTSEWTRNSVQWIWHFLHGFILPNGIQENQIHLFIQSLIASLTNSNQCLVLQRSNLGALQHLR